MPAINIWSIKLKISFYKKIILTCEDEGIVFEAQERIKILNR